MSPKVIVVHCCGEGFLIKSDDSNYVTFSEAKCVSNVKELVEVVRDWGRWAHVDALEHEEKKARKVPPPIEVTP